MDPNACLLALLETIAERDREGAEHYLDCLMQWLERGGFAPFVKIAIDAVRKEAR